MSLAVNYAKAAAASAWMATVGGRGEFSELLEKTAFVVPGDLDPAVCQALVDRMEACIADPAHPRIWRDGVGSDTRVMGFEQDIGELVRHFDIPGRIRAIDEYMGRRTRSWFLMGNRVVPKPDNKGSGGGLHRDSPFSHQVKCIWYLTDVTTSTGPFQFAPHSHRDLLRRRRTVPLGQTRFETYDQEVVEVHASAGSLLVCDTKCVHGGKPIEDGTRYAVTLYTLPTRQGAGDIFRKTGIDPTLAYVSNA